jgi:hypothetical protein
MCGARLSLLKFGRCERVLLHYAAMMHKPDPQTPTVVLTASALSTSARGNSGEHIVASKERGCSGLADHKLEEDFALPTQLLKPGQGLGCK